ncbi:MAG: RsmE family RNA methyltransferase [Acidobacteriota bacterium]
MRHRVFIEALTAPTVTVTGDEFHHSIRVVRARVGEEVEIFDRAGHAARGVVASIERDQAVLDVGEALPSRESPLAIHLAMAIIQLDKFELVLQKATELGVSTLIPMVTDRIELRPERYSGKSERWNRILFEAVKQSGRTRVPLLEKPASLDEVLARPGAKILFDADVAASPLERLAEVTILIGPEGGWTDRELRAAGEGGVLLQPLGPRRLRAETAAIAALAVIASRFGDL